jgi:hypothetical protein
MISPNECQDRPDWWDSYVKKNLQKKLRQFTGRSRLPLLTKMKSLGKERQ